MQNFEFQNLFVFDMANNHQGSVEHGLKIIEQVGKVAAQQNVRAALKFQFRQLRSFIHPEHQVDSKAKHIDRFLSTELSLDQYQTLFDAVRVAGMYTMCTPFDEDSVSEIIKMKFDLIKVASCSAKDWPLLEAIAEASMPTIFSTGGLSLNEIDDVVSFFDHRGVDFAIMHCVSVYPTPDDQLELNQLDVMRRRYRGVSIGWSTHEDQNNFSAVQIAYAKGAEIFERHVGVETTEISLNAYSSTPKQLEKWIASAMQAKKMCGSVSERKSCASEAEALSSLRRGVYIKADTNSGKPLQQNDVYFAMPYRKGQLDSGSWIPGIVLKTNVKTDAPLFSTDVILPENGNAKILKDAIHDYKALLNEAGIVLNSDFQIEFSHHYGVENFRETGALIISCVNREYCKKIIVQLPGQSHPPHFHRRKEETFQVLNGDLDVNVGHHHKSLKPGETVLIQTGVWHSFSSKTGCIFEEISTTHYDDDSFYKDKKISGVERSKRKTVVEHWGRFSLAPQT